MLRPNPTRLLPVAVLIVLGILPILLPVRAQEVASNTTSAPADSFVRASRLGITFINSVDTSRAEERYQHALALGAGWNRWPLYWDRVETEAGQFSWRDYDELVAADLEHGLRTNAILLGAPAFWRDENTIAGLQEPIYADGSDVPGPNKAINPENGWANFVQQAVRRYMPGGILGWQRGWPADRGVTVWEVWNEPDFEQFWQGGVGDYTRMLKIAHIVAHSLDPDTTVMMGGLLYPTRNNWLAQVLGIIINDPFREQNNWYVDAVAVHSYGNAWRSGWLTLYVRQTLIEFELERPIWLNESGVAAWDDYPGPTWLTDDPGGRATRATAAQQAAFFIQSSAYAWAEGADVVFYHQLYDDCGDQAPGTNFAPNDGTRFGDAFGIFRNAASSVCYSQHPQPNTPRPIGRAYELLTEVFGQVPFSERGQVDERQDGTVLITFTRPTTAERVVVAWTTRQEPVTLELDALSATATLHTLGGESTLRANNGEYRLHLAAALTPSQRFTDNGGAIDIGGAPVILIESLSGPAPTTSATTTTEADNEASEFEVFLSEAQIEALMASSPTGVAFTSLNTSRLRNAPNTETSRVVGNLPLGNSASVVGRTRDSGWLQIDYDGQLVWVAAFLGDVHGDLESVPVIAFAEPEAPANAEPAPESVNADPLQGDLIGAASGE